MTGYVHISQRQNGGRKSGSARESQAMLAAQKYKALYERTLATCDSLTGQVEQLEESLAAAQRSMQELELKVQEIEARPVEVAGEENVFYQGYLKQGALEIIEGLIQ